MYKFEIEERDFTKIQTWKEEQDKKQLEKQLSNKNKNDIFLNALTENDIPYYGACGGELTYCFTPNSIGLTITIKHSNGEKLDISHYDEW